MLLLTCCSIFSITIIFITTFLSSLILTTTCSKRKKSNECSRSSRTVKVELPSRETTTSNQRGTRKKMKKSGSADAGAEKKKNQIQHQKTKSKCTKQKSSNIPTQSSNLIKQEIHTTACPPTTAKSITKTLTCEMDNTTGYTSDHPTTFTEESTVIQQNSKNTIDTGHYDNLTVPSEKQDKQKEDS